MTTRNGKIARIPATIREELNERLFNGHEGKILVDWLNRQPLVKKSLAEVFEGRPVSEQNLSEWKQGGYVEWEARRTLLQDAQDMTTYGEQMEAAATDEFVDKLALVLSARLGQLLLQWNGEPSDEVKAKIKVLGQLTKQVLGLQRGMQRSLRTGMAEEKHGWEKFQFDRELAELQVTLARQEADQEMMSKMVKGMKESGEWYKQEAKSEFDVKREREEMAQEEQIVAHEQQWTAYQARQTQRARQAVQGEKPSKSKPIKPNQTDLKSETRNQKSEGNPKPEGNGAHPAKAGRPTQGESKEHLSPALSPSDAEREKKAEGKKPENGVERSDAPRSDDRQEGGAAQWN